MDSFRLPNVERVECVVTLKDGRQYASCVKDVGDCRSGSKVVTRLFDQAKECVVRLGVGFPENIQPAVFEICNGEVLVARDTAGRIVWSRPTSPNVDPWAHGKDEFVPH